MKLLWLAVFCVVSVRATEDINAALRSALSKAINNMVFINDFSQVLGKDRTPQLQKANEGSIDAQRRGDILQETTRILVEQYGTEIFAKLATVDVEGLLKEILAESAKTGRKKRYSDNPLADDKCLLKNNCAQSFPFRSITGFCNNDRDPEVGSTFHPMRRFIKDAAYDDGFNSVRRRSAVAGQTLPSARLISNKVFKEANIPAYDPKYSHMLQQFGQFIAHDTVFTPTAVGKNNEALNCAPCESAEINTNCAPIEVPEDDDYFPKSNATVKQCIRLTRAINGQKGIGPRQQINQDTHFLDLSQVYGNDDCVAADLRTHSRGQMKMYKIAQYTLPPQATNDSNCQSEPNGVKCFFCGDLRNSLHPGLIPLHTIYLLQHNKWADQIATLRPTWTENSIYHETRRLMIALWQFHSFSEYLPKIIGNQMMEKYNLKPSGLKKNFDPRIDPSISVEFGTSAFRFGHSQVRNNLPRTNVGNTSYSSVDLGTNIFYSDSLYTPADSVFQMAMGMINYPAMAVDRQFSFPIRNQMFELRGQKASGVDLSAVNIQRGREEGVHPYNEYRARAGLSKVTNFDQLTADLGAANVALLKGVYKHVNDIDLYVGLLMETPKDSTALLGPTGSMLVADQFDAWKRGDRFFYESMDSAGGLTQAEYKAITNFSFAQMVCENIPGITTIQEDVFIFGAKKVTCKNFQPFPLANILY